MNNKTPKLRFKGFTDAWEQRKVGELIVESKEKGHTGEQARKLTVKLWGNGVALPCVCFVLAGIVYYARNAG